MNTTIAHKIEVLKKIGHALDEAQITWALGGSMLLYLKGITETIHDIDLLVAEEDARHAKEILRQMGTLLPPNPKAEYRPRCFLEYVIDDVNLDLMAGFVIVQNGIAHECPLLQKDIERVQITDDCVLPLHSLAKWKQYYEWMGRTEKAAMIT